MELTDLALEIERFLVSKDIKASDITVNQLIDELYNDGFEEL
ncbi:hypothetical protein [Virgibacillus profundi]|nr:hypothetical protein [Virgibacillus profundi]